MADLVENPDNSPPSEPKLSGLASAASAIAGRGPAPVHLWNPPDCGDIGLKIHRDGAWTYQNSPIGRAAMVQLFSNILRKDANGYFLVTPIEKIAIEVEDAPFVAVEMLVDEAGGAATLRFRTNVETWVSAGAGHPLRFDTGPADGVKPYVHIRADLWALVSRAVFYDLVARGETRDIEGVAMYGVASGGEFFVIAPAARIDNLR